MSKLAKRNIIRTLSRRFFLALIFIAFFSINSYFIGFFSNINSEFVEAEKKILLISTLSILIFIWFFIYKPIKRKLQHYIGELIRKDNELMQANIDLEKTVNERTHSLIEKEKKYRTLVEKMNEGVALYTPEGIFTFVNEKYCQILGYYKNELINQPIFKIFFFEDIEKIKQNISLRKMGISGQYEIAVPRKDGRKILLHVNSSAICKNDCDEKKCESEITGIMSVITDITEKRENEIQLSELNKFNETLLQTIPFGMQVVDMEGTILYTNKKMRELAGCNTIGKKCWAVIHDDKMPCNNCIRTDVMKSGKLNICELQQVLGEKTAHIYQAHINYNNSNAVLELFVNITKLKETEQKLISKNAELNSFIFRASHDMRSPVANVLGLVNSYRYEYPSHAKQYIDFIDKSAKKMDQILHELINIGRINHNTINISEINLPDLVEQLKKETLLRDDFSGMNFVSEINSNGTYISDRNLLYSILINLIDNSIKYKNVRVPNSFISLKIKPFKNGISIKISDNGQGMNQNVQEHAFEMFFRGNESSTGTGLGLYFVKISVEKLEGTIKLQSEENVGSTFNIFLPSLKK